MTEANQQVQDLPPPPASLLDHASLFLDFDGTLIELAERPDAVKVDSKLQTLVTRLHERHQGRLAVISGRSIAQLDELLGPVARKIALSGSHGCEHRWSGISAQPVAPPELKSVAARMRAFAESHPGTLVEEKSFGVALHFRLAPSAEAAAGALAEALSREFGLFAQYGKMVVELRPAGGDKGVAVERLMRRTDLQGTRPLFLGDDLTDEPGFRAASAHGGAGILVGPPRVTFASYRLSDPDAVRRWLDSAAAG